MKKLFALLSLCVALTAVPTSGEDIWFMWSPNPGLELVSSYRMEYQKFPVVTNWTYLTSVPASTNVAVVRGIQGGFVYKFRIFAVNGVGIGTNLSNIISIPTNKPSMVNDFQLRP